MSGVRTVAIAGASGSGKSTLVAGLLAELNADAVGTAVALPIDAYYRDLSHLDFSERDVQNFDHPDALELDLLVDHLDELRAGRGIDIPVYDFATHTRTTATRRVEYADVVVVEGILALAEPRLTARCDLTIFVDTPLELCLARRIARDAKERGRSEASVRQFWFDRVLPMFEQFGEPASKQASLIVDGQTDVRQAIGTVRAALQERR